VCVSLCVCVSVSVCVRVCVSEFPGARAAALPLLLGGGGSLHVGHQGGRRPEAQEPRGQRHAEERPQAAVDGPAER